MHEHGASAAEGLEGKFWMPSEHLKVVTVLETIRRNFFEKLCNYLRRFFGKLRAILARVGSGLAAVGIGARDPLLDRVGVLHEVQQPVRLLALSRARDRDGDTPLAKQNAIPQKQLDDDIANQAAAQSELTAKKAAQQQDELNLGWTNVYSPVDGIAGVATSQVGDLVGTTSKMTTVSQIDPIWAYFNVSESLYLSFASQISRALQRSATKSHVPVEYIQANDVPYPFKGNIIFLNREITAGTGTIQLAAAFPNRDAILRPGGFGRVRVQTNTSKNALLVPQAAVIEVQSQYQLFVVGSDNKATVRPVKVGDRVGPNWIITEGLKPGERVVVEGIQKMQTFAAQAPDLAKEGIPVSPKVYAAPAGGGD